MDSFLFQAMAVELDQRIGNSRLDKVVQTGAGTLVLKLWTGQEKVQLLIKAEGRGAYYLTDGSYPAPARPPRICQLLRARLRRLDKIYTEPGDRVVHLLFSGPDQRRYDLVFEAIGTQSNLVLVDEQGRIVDLLYRREDKRTLLPGERYQLPEQQDRIPLFGDIESTCRAMQQAESSADSGFSAIAPMSPILAVCIAHARSSGQSCEAILTRLSHAFHTGTFNAHSLELNGRKGLMPVALLDDVEPLRSFQDISSLVEAAQNDDEQDATRDLASRLQSVIKKQVRFLHKRKVKIAAEREKQSDPEHFKVSGELLLANLHRVKRGDESVEVEDYYRSPSVLVTIDLDTRLTANENAERYFKKYRKARRSGDHHARRLKETEDELKWLADVELALDEAVTGEDLYQVQLDLEAAGLINKTTGKLGKRQPARPEDQLYNAVSPAGWQLYWGKNSRTNDYVSKTMTASQDYWFHAKGMPGSHLVLKCGEVAGNVAEEDILFAASLAAGYSKGKHDNKVEVIVARGRDVNKPKGAKPGLVTVDTYRSVIVNPGRLDD